MDLYNFDKDTKVFLSKTLARRNPLFEEGGNDEFLKAGNSTFIANKNNAGANQVEIFTGDSWIVTDNFIGDVYFDVDGVKHEITELGVKPDLTWAKERPFILSEAKELKKAEIRESFINSLKLPVVLNGVSWDSGIDSATRLDSGKRFAQMLGLSSVIFYDVDNIGHDLTIVEAEAVIIGVGVDYQSKYVKKQSLMVQVDAIGLGAVQSDIDLIQVVI